MDILFYLCLMVYNKWNATDIYAYVSDISWNLTSAAERCT